MYKFKSQFDPEGQGHQSSFQLSQMPLNEQFKSEGKIPNGSKVVTFTRNHKKIFIFKTNSTLKDKVTSFQI